MNFTQTIRTLSRTTRAAALAGGLLLAGVTGQAFAAGLPDVMVGYLVGPTQLSANQTQHFQFRVQGAGAADAEGIRFDVSSQNLPLQFVSVVQTQDQTAGGSHFACAVVDASAPAARIVCKGGTLQPHSAATFDLTTRTAAIATHGQGTMTIQIDPLNTIHEGNEANNSRTINVNY